MASREIELVTMIPVSTYRELRCNRSVAVGIESAVWHITREFKFVVPDSRPFGPPDIFELDQSVVGEFVDVFGHFGWMPIDKASEFADAVWFMFNNRL